jgi:hypothetical protein
MHAGASKCILDNRKCLSSISTSIFAQAFNFICQKYIPPKHTHTHIEAMDSLGRIRKKDMQRVFNTTARNGKQFNNNNKYYFSL